MKFDELFEQRSLVASKLKDCIRDMGYTKVSFAAKADISRPTLDKLLNTEITQYDGRRLDVVSFSSLKALYSNGVFTERTDGS